MKKIFTDNGFTIVYDRDVTRQVGDGFFFTLGYPGMTGGELLLELMYYGVSSKGCVPAPRGCATSFIPYWKNG